MNTKIILALSCLILFACWGCTSLPRPEETPKTQTPLSSLETPTPETGASKETLFQNLMPIEDMNQSLQISTPESLNNDFKIGRSVRVLVENTTEFNFVHPSALKPDIFAFGVDTWEAIDNIMNYVGQEKEIIEAHGLSVATILPKPLKYDEPIEIRIVVVGDLVDEQGNVVRPAGAYIDVVLEP